MAKKHDLMAYLKNNKLTDYGSVIDGAEVRKIIGIEYPVVATKAVFDALSLEELSAIDYCRNVLLKTGRYLAQYKGNYRILLKSENHAQARSHMRSADKKLKNAMALMEVGEGEKYTSSSDAARLLLKRESIQRMNQAVN